METLLHIGAPKESLKEATKHILEIMTCKSADEETKREGLRVLPQIVVSPHEVTVTNCNFISKPTEKAKKNKVVKKKIAKKKGKV